MFISMNKHLVFVCSEPFTGNTWCHDKSFLEIASTLGPQGARSTRVHWQRPQNAKQAKSLPHLILKSSSLVTSYNLINLSLSDSSRMENFLSHLMASLLTSLSMSKSLEMMITILESKQILHCSISQVVRLFEAGIKTTFHLKQK